jgi:hypothetical protein
MNHLQINRKSQICILGFILIFGLSILPVFSAKYITENPGNASSPDTLSGIQINDTASLPELFTILKKDFKIYPNPVKNILNLTFTADITSDGEIFIRDILGKEVKRFSFEISSGINQFSFPVDDFHKGIYFIEFYTLKKRILTKKIIKE